MGWCGVGGAAGETAGAEGPGKLRHRPLFRGARYAPPPRLTPRLRPSAAGNMARRSWLFKTDTSPTASACCTLCSCCSWLFCSIVQPPRTLLPREKQCPGHCLPRSPRNSGLSLARLPRHGVLRTHAPAPPLALAAQFAAITLPSPGVCFLQGDAPSDPC